MPDKSLYSAVPDSPIAPDDDNDRPTVIEALLDHPVLAFFAAASLTIFVYAAYYKLRGEA